MASRIRTFSSNGALVDERRRHIVDCCLKMFVEKGYARTTTDDILRASGMGRGTFYHYVSSKRDIVRLIVGETMSGLKDIPAVLRSVENMSPSQALSRAVEWYLTACDRAQDRIMFALRESVYLDADDRRDLMGNLASFVDFFEGLLKRGIDAGEFQVGNPSVLAHDIVALGHAWVLGRWFLRKKVTIEEYAKQQSEWILKAIRVDRGLTNARMPAK